MYVDNPNQGIDIGDMTVSDSSSGDSGGVFYFTQVATVKIYKISTLSHFSTFIAPVKGSFLCSVAPTLILQVNDALIECSLTAMDYATHI